MDKNFVKLIERIGFVNKKGERVKGTAALLHFVHTPFSEFDTKYIEIGKRYVQNLINT